VSAGNLNGGEENHSSSWPRTGEGPSIHHHPCRLQEGTPLRSLCDQEPSDAQRVDEKEAQRPNGERKPKQA
jgi:hypothetical protein